MGGRTDAAVLASSSRSRIDAAAVNANRIDWKSGMKFVILFAALAVGFVVGALWQRMKTRRELIAIRKKLEASGDALERAVNQNKPE